MENYSYKMKTKQELPFLGGSCFVLRVNMKGKVEAFKPKWHDIFKIKVSTFTE